MSDPYKILFASRHFYLDQSNGASISTRSLLQELAKRRWNVKTFCGFQQDYIRPTTIETELAKHELQHGEITKDASFLSRIMALVH